MNGRAREHGEARLGQQWQIRQSTFVRRFPDWVVRAGDVNDMPQGRPSAHSIVNAHHGPNALPLEKIHGEAD